MISLDPWACLLQRPYYQIWILRAVYVTDESVLTAGNHRWWSGREGYLLADVDPSVEGHQALLHRILATFFFFFLPPRFSCNSKVMGSSIQLQLGFKREFPCYHLYRCPMKDTNCRPPRGTRTKMPAGRRGLNVHMICVAPILCSFILIALRHARMDVMMDTIPR